MSFNSPAAAVGCYSTGEEIANSVTHGVAALLSIAGLVVMLSMMPVTAGAATITAAAVFGASMIFLYTASTLYHAIPNLRVKRILQVLDHSAIYVMIAGSYTPFCLVTLKGTTGTMLCIAVWSIALAGIILQPVLMKRAEWLNCLLYLLLGWCVVLVFEPLMAALPYTTGILFYKSKKYYMHFIWHLFVLGGTALQFFSVLFYVLPAGAA